MATLNSATITAEELAKTIDHSLLQPQLTDDEVRAGCELARAYKVASVCVKPYHVGLAHELLAGTDVAVSTVIGFPHGSSTVAAKVFEAQEAVAAGATELDMVINIGKLRSGDVDYVRDEIRAVVEAGGGALIKVIVEIAYLDNDQKIAAYRASEEAGAKFVKTSTGYAPTGATIEDIRLMRATVGAGVAVKASHGIRTLDQAMAMIDAGATRIGASATKTILDAYLAGEIVPETMQAPGY